MKRSACKQNVKFAHEVLAKDVLSEPGSAWTALTQDPAYYLEIIWEESKVDLPAEQHCNHGAPVCERVSSAELPAGYEGVLITLDGHFYGGDAMAVMVVCEPARVHQTLRYFVMEVPVGSTGTAPASNISEWTVLYGAGTYVAYGTAPTEDAADFPRLLGRILALPRVDAALGGPPAAAGMPDVLGIAAAAIHNAAGSAGLQATITPGPAYAPPPQASASYPYGQAYGGAFAAVGTAQKHNARTGLVAYRWVATLAMLAMGLGYYLSQNGPLAEYANFG